MTVCKPCKKAGSLLTQQTPGLQPAIDKLHRNCRGGTWCDCQHQSDRTVLREDRKADPRRGG